MCALRPKLTLVLEHGPAAAEQARRFVAGELCRQHAAAVADDAVLVASELATDACARGRPPLVLSLDCHVARVEIRLVTMRPRDPDGAAPAGIGLPVVDRLTETWGLRAGPHVHDYWCVLPILGEACVTE